MVIASHIVTELSSNGCLEKEIAMRQGIFLLLCLLVPSSVYSVEFAGGTGEPNDPYQIATAEQLIGMGDGELQSKHFVLIADIDLDPNLPGNRVFEDALIAPDRDETHSVSRAHYAPFMGVFDGQGHTIANLHIAGKFGHETGLFGFMHGLVKNLNLVDVAISGTPCGAIAGSNDGVIQGCRVTGQVSGIEQIGGIVGSGGSLVECRAEVTVTGETNVGGLVGAGGESLARCHAQAEVYGQQNVGGLVGSGYSVDIMACQATGVVSGRDSVGGLIGNGRAAKIMKSRAACFISGSENIGGLVGDSAAMILESAAHCEVTAEQRAGGLAGRLSSDGLYMDSYTRGKLSGALVGGLAGETNDRPQFFNCYAACELFSRRLKGQNSVLGGLFGTLRSPLWPPSVVHSCFWDAELSQTTASIGSDSTELGRGLLTDQMQDQEALIHAGWVFSHIWTMCENDYPRLRWESEDCNALLQ